LTRTEKRVVDAVDRVLANLPWAKGDDEANFALYDQEAQEALPHRYISWERNRESNVVLAFVFGLLGAGRPQPSACERSILLLLYAAISFFNFTIWGVVGSPACRAAWVAQCVPPTLGGACESQCATPEVLASWKPDWASYSFALSESALRSLNFTAMVEGHNSTMAGWSPCKLPLCVHVSGSCYLEKSNQACEPGGNDGANAMCPCNKLVDMGNSVMQACFLLIFMKALYIPVLKVFLTSFESSPNCCLRMLNTIVAAFTVVFCGRLFLLALHYNAENVQEGLMPLFFAHWLANFLGLTILEAVKGFLLGHVVGYYFVRPLCCTSLWQVWRAIFS